MSAPTIRVNVGKRAPIDARFVRVATREDFVAQYGEAEITGPELEAIKWGGYFVVRQVIGERVVGPERTVHHTAVVAGDLPALVKAYDLTWTIDNAAALEGVTDVATTFAEPGQLQAEGCPLHYIGCPAWCPVLRAAKAAAPTTVDGYYWVTLEPSQGRAPVRPFLIEKQGLQWDVCGSEDYYTADESTGRPDGFIVLGGPLVPPALDASTVEAPPRRCTGRLVDESVERCERAATLVCTAPDGLQWYACELPAHSAGATTEPIGPWFARMFVDHDAPTMAPPAADVPMPNPAIGARTAEALRAYLRASEPQPDAARLKASGLPLNRCAVAVAGNGYVRFFLQMGSASSAIPCVLSPDLALNLVAWISVLADDVDDATLLAARRMIEAT